jgi:hypothetical protein
MKWLNRFALLAVLGAMPGSVAVAGCGGDNEDAPATQNRENDEDDD